MKLAENTNLQYLKSFASELREAYESEWSRLSNEDELSAISK